MRINKALPVLYVNRAKTKTGNKSLILTYQKKCSILFYRVLNCDNNEEYRRSNVLGMFSMNSSRLVEVWGGGKAESSALCYRNCG